METPLAYRVQRERTHDAWEQTSSEVELMETRAHFRHWCLASQRGTNFFGS